MMVTSPVIGPLSVDACRAFLARGGMGQVAVTYNALPVIQPVPFVFHDEYVVIRAPNRSSLCRAVKDSVIAFNVHHFEGGGGQGWSVLVQGVGEEVTDSDLLRSLLALPLPSWSDEPETDCIMRLPITKITGAQVR
jgi:nitroimidazol reductase NimA-like FMN-containing flavoprotein (pyridoxamine 5'-phosphate oxidase superfamily)